MVNPPLETWIVPLNLYKPIFTLYDVQWRAWHPGGCVCRQGPATVGRDEKTIREYIRNQEAEDRRLDQLSLLK